MSAPGRPGKGVALLALLAVLLLAGGCGRKARPEPLFSRADATNHYETR